METEFSKILVCLEMIRTDADVIGAAGRMADLTHAKEVVFAYVYPSTDIPDEMLVQYENLAPDVDELRAEMEAKVKQYYSGKKDAGLRFEIHTGNAVREFAYLAASEDIDLIIAAQPASGAGQSHDGSRIARRLAYKSHCSMLTVPEKGEVKLERVLVPVRNSECSRRALQTAIDLACAACESPEVFTHYVYPVSPGYARVGLSYQEFATALRDYAEREYAALMNTIHPRAARVTPIITDDPEDDPSKLILEAVNERGADAVAIGSRGRTGMAGIILGHVTETLIASSPVPVFQVKQKGENVGLLQALGIVM